MANTYFQFKQFRIDQDKTAMKVTTDGCLLGAWAASLISGHSIIGELESTGNLGGQGEFYVESESPAIARVLDIGAGTGLLALMIAQATNHTIDALEIEDQAAIQAVENIDNSKWKDRITLVHADVRDYKADGPYNYIVSNPPFYENELKSGRAEKDLAHHDDGLTLDDLFEAMERNLSDDGRFYLLLPYKRKEDFFQRIATSGFHVEVMEQVRQTLKHSPFRLLVCGSRQKPSLEPVLGDRSIKGDGSEYTEWFIGLLRPYYLNI
ncbi:MAG: methyltransferase domain-containing protein [Chitinophagaceae bacterium]|nr:MAG: methyltransferase domain-containing protein [Chitinophagaceae bacterium]